MELRCARKTPLSNRPGPGRAHGGSDVVGGGALDPRHVVPLAVRVGGHGGLVDLGSGPTVGDRRGQLFTGGERAQELGRLDHLHVVEAHRGAGAGLEPVELREGRAGHHAGVALELQVTAEADLQVVEMLEVPAQRTLRAVHLDDVLGARADADPGGLEGADDTVLEADEQGDPVLVLDRAQLVGDLPAAVADADLGRDGPLGDEGLRDGGDRRDPPDQVLHQVGAVAHQVTDHAGAAAGALVAPGQRALRGGGVVRDQPGPDVGDPAQPAGADQRTGLLDGGRVTVVEADRGDQARGLGGPGDVARLGGRDAHRLLDPERLAGLDGGQRHLAVQEVRCADRHHVDLGIGQHLAVVRRRPLEPERADGGEPGLGHGVTRGHQPRADLQVREILGDAPVGAGVHPAHPPEADHPHADAWGTAGGYVRHVAPSLLARATPLWPRVNNRAICSVK
ncbi:hypothetical protein SDC9_62724 [bioreactor metagenome]|uniref:Uncharacterized protein n=1 Tax=bioreactor metagenome TaxID=1076179 RepID=A0A644XJH3_9ZZZZ